MHRRSDLLPVLAVVALTWFLGRTCFKRSRQESNTPPIQTGKHQNRPAGNAQDSALPDRTAQIDPDLAEVVEGWPTLPATIRAAIVGLVKASGGKA
ncbi:MAG: hypothetical protein K8T25_17665 [Planctomycetia bacterium]|nr:hypothetical protein [Planctomycetia bacterium]